MQGGEEKRKGRGRRERRGEEGREEEGLDPKWGTLSQSIISGEETDFVTDLPPVEGKETELRSIKCL